MRKSLFARWRANFLAGLAVVLPAVISIAVVVWLFRNVSNLTDTLLIFLPKEWTHQRDGDGKMYWYWSVCALALAILLIGLVGRLARNYVGKQLIGMIDLAMLKVPLLNKIYGAIKQVNDAFSSSNTSFKQVVLVEFPRAGQYSIGFVTGADHQLGSAQATDRMLSIFVPTTPNPTSGFLVMTPEREVTKLNMSVAEGIKFIISLGAISPEQASPLDVKHPAPRDSLSG